MRTGSKQKLKYVIILEILRQETGADHPMQTNNAVHKKKIRILEKLKKILEN